MVENDGSKYRVGRFAWYHWVIVVFGAFSGLLTGGVAGAVGATIGTMILVAVARAVWNGLGLLLRRDVDEATG